LLVKKISHIETFECVGRELCGHPRRRWPMSPVSDHPLNEAEAALGIHIFNTKGISNVGSGRAQVGRRRVGWKGSSGPARSLIVSAMRTNMNKCFIWLSCEICLLRQNSEMAARKIRAGDKITLRVEADSVWDDGAQVSFTIFGYPSRVTIPSDSSSVVDVERRSRFSMPSHMLVIVASTAALVTALFLEW
jgi:hypothetical protein